jgi:hypothetical protein
MFPDVGFTTPPDENQLFIVGVIWLRSCGQSILEGMYGFRPKWYASLYSRLLPGIVQLAGFQVQGLNRHKG